MSEVDISRARVVEFRNMLVKWFNENLAEDLPSTVRGTPVKVSTDEYLRANRDA